MSDDPRLFEQGSDEWIAARLGKLTASRVSDALARTKSGWGSSRANYRAELICERLSGFPYAGYTNSYMDRGKELEEAAITAYNLMVEMDTAKTGFWPHPTIANFGASPDRIVGRNGLAQVKCRKTALHFNLIITQSIPGDVLSQMRSELACTDREWNDLISFDPDAPPGLEIFVKRVFRDEQAGEIVKIEREAVEFLETVENHMRELQSRLASDTLILIDRETVVGDLSAQLEGSLAMLGTEGNVVPIKTKRQRTPVE